MRFVIEQAVSPFAAILFEVRGDKIKQFVDDDWARNPARDLVVFVLGGARIDLALNLVAWFARVMKLIAPAKVDRPKIAD